MGLSASRTFHISFPDSPAPASVSERLTAGLVESNSGSREVKEENEEPH